MGSHDAWKVSFISFGNTYSSHRLSLWGTSCIIVCVQHFLLTGSVHSQAHHHQVRSLFLNIAPLFLALSSSLTSPDTFPNLRNTAPGSGEVLHSDKLHQCWMFKPLSQPFASSFPPPLVSAKLYSRVAHVKDLCLEKDVLFALLCLRMGLSF